MEKPQASLLQSKKCSRGRDCLELPLETPFPWITDQSMGNTQSQYLKALCNPVFSGLSSPGHLVFLLGKLREQKVLLAGGLSSLPLTSGTPLASNQEPGKDQAQAPRATLSAHH